MFWYYHCEILVSCSIVFEEVDCKLKDSVISCGFVFDSVNQLDIWNLFYTLHYEVSLCKCHPYFLGLDSSFDSMCFMM